MILSCHIDIDHSRQIWNFVEKINSDISETFRTGFGEKISKRKANSISPTIPETLALTHFRHGVEWSICMYALNEYASVEVIIINWCDFYYIYRIFEDFFTQNTDAYSGISIYDRYIISVTSTEYIDGYKSHFIQMNTNNLWMIRGNFDDLCAYKWWIVYLTIKFGPYQNKLPEFNRSLFCFWVYM